MVKNFLILVLTIISIASLSVNFVLLNNVKPVPSITAISPTVALQIKPSDAPTPTKSIFLPTPTVQPLTEEQIFQKAFDSGITFTPIVNSVMKWGDSMGTYPINAKSISAKNVSADQLAVIRGIFSENGYATNAYNEGYGTVIGTQGFKNEDSICLIETQVANYNQMKENKDVPPAKESDITISCATL